MLSADPPYPPHASKTYGDGKIFFSQILFPLATFPRMSIYYDGDSLMTATRYAYHPEQTKNHSTIPSATEPMHQHYNMFFTRTFFPQLSLIPIVLLTIVMAQSEGRHAQAAQAHGRSRLEEREGLVREGAFPQGSSSSWAELISTLWRFGVVPK